MQRSFLDAFLKGDDRVGWSVEGKLPAVGVVLRKGDVGFNDAEAERAYQTRTETEWPIARTQDTPYYLTPTLGLQTEPTSEKHVSKLSYPALGTMDKPQLLQFTTAPFTSETEITGHVTAHLNVSLSQSNPDPKLVPSDIDLFITLRHISPEGKEVFYTGTAGDPVPLCKGWLRVSMRKVNKEHRRNRPWLPYRDYFSSDKLPVIPGEVYPVDVEIWPTNVVVSPGGKIVLEVASGDTQGCGRFQHTSTTDRYVSWCPSTPRPIADP